MPKNHPMTSTRCGYTLIETIVVISILGLMISLLLPAVQDVRGAAKKLACANNLKQISLGLHHHEATHGRLPASSPWRGATDNPLSWQEQTLPFLDQESLHQLSIAALKQDVVTHHNPPHVGYTTVVPVLVCPAESRLVTPLTTPSGDVAAFGSYLGVWGKFSGPVRVGILGNSPGVALNKVTDGLSNTLMVGERPPPSSLQAGRWYSGRHTFEPFPGPDLLLGIPHLVAVPEDFECTNAAPVFGPGVISNPCDRFHNWSLHRGGANFSFGDASVRFIRYEARQLLPALASMSGGEPSLLPE